jgi:hypothetical protein
MLLMLPDVTKGGEVNEKPLPTGERAAFYASRRVPSKVSILNNP